MRVMYGELLTWGRERNGLYRSKNKKGEIGCVRMEWRFLWGENVKVCLLVF